MIKHSQQPTDSNLCGQHCVAMITGKSVKSLIKIMGSGKTRTEALCRGLGIRKTKLKRLNSVKLPKLAIYKVIWRSRNAHWVVAYKSMIYDPLNNMPVPFSVYMDWLSTRGKITSCLEIS